MLQQTETARLVSRILPPHLQDSLWRTHRRARAGEVNLSDLPDTAIGLLYTAFNNDASLAVDVRDQFFEAVKRSPGPIYSAKIILAMLSAQGPDGAEVRLKEILDKLQSGLKIIRDGGVGVPLAGVGSQSGSSSPLEVCIARNVWNFL